MQTYLQVHDIEGIRDLRVWRILDANIMSFGLRSIRAAFISFQISITNTCAMLLESINFNELAEPSKRQETNRLMKISIEYRNSSDSRLSIR